ncbi:MULTISPECIES: IclR family transcriptional regulator [Saccharopolyspora]|uniref:IclR family transcriptional regulator n=1 Tax=Saccharopolyspora cebuensis TaxID=418759 RepID=A0ABV4CR07_9PSEU
MSEGLSSVHRALEVLRALGAGPMRVQDVAEALGKEKTQVSRTLKVLAEAGFAERDADLSYRLGWGLFALAGQAGDERLLHQAPEVLRGLVRRLGEAAYLTVRGADTAVTVLTERPGRALQAHEWIGRTTPLSCTSSGRALLTGLSDAELAEVLGDAPLPGTDRAPRDLPALLRRVRAERAAGHVVAAEEYEPGLVAVAAPVRDFRGAVVAALNVSAPVFRLPPDALEPVVAEVADAAGRLSAALGG